MIVVVIGATRGLGFSLAQQYSANGAIVIGTARSATVNDETASDIKWIKGVDISKPEAGDVIASNYHESAPIDILVVGAGYFGKEGFDNPDWSAQEVMYKTSAIGPVFVVSKLVRAGLLKGGSKIVMVSSEAGSISLRHQSEGASPEASSYGHHASKCALNMITKLLSIDLEPRGIAIVSVHPGFMRTDMTKSVGFDKFWESGGAISPHTAAKSLIDWISSSLDMTKTGQFWAPRGPSDIGTVDAVLGPKDKLPTPLQLPW